MTKRIKNEYVPDYISPPGETLLETLETIGMSQAELAERTGRPKKTINEIIQGKAAITSETAIQLERVLGVPASFWNNYERNYREALARRDEQERLRQQTEWLKKLPVRALVKAGYIREQNDDVRRLQDTLSFFGVASPQAWEEVWTPKQVAFRKCKSFESEPGAVAAWLRIGEMKAKQIACAPYDKKRFYSALKEIRALTCDVSLLKTDVTELCASAGVAIAIVPELPKTRVCGAARWLLSDKALIQLSGRYKRDDNLWFSFFHEAGHILLHSKREVFLDCGDEIQEEREKEADTFAADLLIPPPKWRELKERGTYSRSSVISFADEIGISPGVVVGRLQREKLIPYNQLTDLFNRLSLQDSASL